MITLLTIIGVYIIICIIDILAFKYLYPSKITVGLKMYIFFPIIHIFTLPFIVIDKIEGCITDWINKDKI